MKRTRVKGLPHDRPIEIARTPIPAIKLRLARIEQLMHFRNPIQKEKSHGIKEEKTQGRKNVAEEGMRYQNKSNRSKRQKDGKRCM